MPLKVAACPVCKSPLVFGERRCRKCGQSFNYGASAPPPPSFAQIVEALSAAGHEIPMELFGDDPPLPPAKPAASAGGPVRGGAAAPQTPQRPPEPKVPTMEGLDTGRFKSVGDVQGENIPGFIDSSLFAKFTPEHVDATPIFGLDTGRAEVGEVRVQQAPGIEMTSVDDVGEVQTTNISGIFHSDFLKAPPVPVQTGTLEGLDISPSVTRAKPTKKDDKQKKTDELRAIVCRCGETHPYPRCPSCGTIHRDLE
jgi:hypothetical protein